MALSTDESVPSRFVPEEQGRGSRCGVGKPEFCTSHIKRAQLALLLDISARGVAQPMFRAQKHAALLLPPSESNHINEHAAGSEGAFGESTGFSH